MANVASLSPHMSSLLRRIQDTHVIFMLNIYPPCEQANQDVLMIDVHTKTLCGDDSFCW